MDPDEAFTTWVAGRRCDRRPVRSGMTMARRPTSAVAAIVIVASALAACGSDPRESPDDAASRPTSAPESSTTPSPSLAGGLPLGPHPVTKEIGTGVEITVTIGSPGWHGEPNEGWMCWDACDDRGAALIAYNDRDYYVYGDPCRWSTTGPDAPARSADDFVATLAEQASREASIPEDITLDGYTGKKVILRMSDNPDLAFSAGDFPDCDDAHFSLFGVAGEHPARWSQEPGQIEEVWAVDVNDVIAVLIGLYYPETPQDDVDEVRALLASMTFTD